MLAIPNLASPDNLFVRLIRAIVAGDTREAAELLESSPSLARQCLSEGAIRQVPTDFFFKRIRHYLWWGYSHALGCRGLPAEHCEKACWKGYARNGGKPARRAAAALCCGRLTWLVRLESLCPGRSSSFF